MRRYCKLLIYSLSPSIPGSFCRHAIYQFVSVPRWHTIEPVAARSLALGLDGPWSPQPAFREAIAVSTWRVSTGPRLRLGYAKSCGQSRRRSNHASTVVSKHLVRPVEVTQELGPTPIDLPFTPCPQKARASSPEGNPDRCLDPGVSVRASRHAYTTIISGVHPSYYAPTLSATMRSVHHRTRAPNGHRLNALPTEYPE